MKKEYYKKLDIIRVLSCFAVLLYHLNILKGGYLAVCIFFALTGYLSIVSNYNKEFSIKKYYQKRLKKIYLPLLIILFLTLGILKILPNMNYIIIKRELYSILFGYNNFWQLNANLDYFVRNINSPFIHLWYIAILLQYELVFPFILLFIKKLKEKTNKIVPIIFVMLLTIASYIFFIMTFNSNIMSAYYNTFTRAYSILLGVLLGLIHIYYKPLIINKLKNIIYYIYILVLCLLFVLIDIKLPLSYIFMLLTTLITLRLIDYSIMKEKENKLLKKIANMTYEIYLVQYPVIYIFQNISMNNYMKLFLIIITTLIIAYIINKLVNYKKTDNKLFLILFLAITIISLFGFYNFIITKDNHKEMKKLEQDLANNQELMKAKKEEYLKSIKQEEDEWNNTLSSFDNPEALNERIKNLHIVGIGDSIMELALPDLYDVFPNGYFDAATNRTIYKVNDILLDLINRGALGDVVVMCIGTNGEFYDRDTEEVMATLGDRDVFWLNATNADYDTFNGDLYALASRHSNIHIIDWVSVINEHPEYLISDRVHPTVRGCKIYAQYIYDSIYNYYLSQMENEKEAKIKEHEQKELEKITFIGNDLLLGLYNYLEEDYNNSEFIIVEESYDKLKKELNNNINHNIVLLLDNNFKINKNEYIELSNKYKDHNIYIVTLNNDLKIKKGNIKIIKYTDYKTKDGIHLDDDSNKDLYNTIKKIIK